MRLDVTDLPTKDFLVYQLANPCPAFEERNGFRKRRNLSFKYDSDLWNVMLPLEALLLCLCQFEQQAKDSSHCAPILFRNLASEFIHYDLTTSFGRNGNKFGILVHVVHGSWGYPKP
jgi:hypothetical protein